MQRRPFIVTLAIAARSAWAQKNPPQGPASPGALEATWAALEARTGGRLGVALWDSGSDTLLGHRLDERFPMCSTFKWLLAAWALHRVAQGELSLGERLRFSRAAVQPNSPLTRRHAGGPGLTVAQLCEAAVVDSDNTAANVLLGRLGGPAGFTAHARHLGDPDTRLDRLEPDLNHGRDDDPRDTTTPRGMARSLRTALLGDALPPAQRAQLKGWMVACRTGADRLRAGLPADAVVGHKTGTGERGSLQDVAVIWPRTGAPWVLVAYQQGSRAPDTVLKATLADVARAAAARRPA